MLLENFAETTEKYKTHMNRYFIVADKLKVRWDELRNLKSPEALRDNLFRILQSIRDSEIEMMECMQSVSGDVQEYTSNYMTSIRALEAEVNAQKEKLEKLIAEHNAK